MALQGKPKWIVAGIITTVAVVLLCMMIRKFVGNSSAGEDSRNRWFVCAETRKPFKTHLEVGMSIPVMSPYSKKATGYPAELCFWTEAGSVKKDPTPVLLNRYVDPNDNSPTFCPDCGRLVVAHNPAPVEGHAPPTLQEWMQRHGGAAGLGNPPRQ